MENYFSPSDGSLARQGQGIALYGWLEFKLVTCHQWEKRYIRPSDKPTILLI